MASESISFNERSEKILQQLYNDNNGELGFDTISELLAEFRVLTREKTLSPEVLNKKCIDLLMKHSINCHTEAQKCLSNLILNYASIREQLIDPYVNCVELRLSNVLKDQNHTSMTNLTSKKQKFEVLYYDLRIIFLLSALCSNSRAKIRDRLVDPLLEFTGMEADEFSHDNYLLVVESLKALFNLTLDKCLNKPLAGDVIKKLFALVGTDKDMDCDAETDTKLDLTDQLLVNLIHLLTNMPKEVYMKLSNDDVNKMLNHLDNQLKTYSKHSFRDTVLPVLNVCANICKYNEEVRKNWFNEIIGSSTNFEKRPEEYDTLRGRLVKLMTSVDVHIKDIAAEFMHALCGGDTEKFITYTGFGNSAAFLSSRGLMGASKRGSQDSENASDETYKQLRNKIDPMTGKLETPRKNPMEGMSQEEKEYHAHELADAIAKLSNLGMVKPMGIDKDGKLSEINPGSQKDDDEEETEETDD